MSEIIFLVYYKINYNCFRAYYYPEGIYKTISKLPEDMSNFYMMKSKDIEYKADDENLRIYAMNLLKDRNQLLEHVDFDYIIPYGMQKSRTHFKCIECFFNKYANKKESQKFETITSTEHKWMSKCYNGGLTFINRGIHELYGYDHKRFYQHIMIDNDFLIPFKQGEEKKFKYLIDPKTNKYRPLMIGYYNVEITCEDEEFNKIFKYSPHNVYTHFSLKFCIKYEQKYNIKIKLNLDCDKNSYVYEKKNCMPFHKVCIRWSDEINRLKELMPTNGLLKMMSSSVWGHLSKKRTFIKTKQQVKEEGLQDKIENDDSLEYQILHYSLNKERTGGWYKLVKNDDMYYTSYRLKAFITSFGRVKMAESLITLDCINDVQYLNTDGFCTTKPIENYNTIPNLLVDKSHTGKFQIRQTNQPFLPVD